MFRRSSAISLALALAACTQTPLDAYRKAHPGWSPDFPRAGVGAEETIASIYAPHEIERGSITEVRKLRAFSITPAVRELDLETLARGVAGESVLVAHVTCSAPKPIGWFYNDAISWLVFRDGQLTAWHYLEYQEYCHAVLDFREVDPPSDAARDAIRDLLASMTDIPNDELLTEAVKPPTDPPPSEVEALAESACPGRTAFAGALREALLREPSVHTYFVSHDLVLTIAIESDRSFELTKIRPTDFFARQLVQQVRKVSLSDDRPEPPSCLVGSELELAFPR